MIPDPADATTPVAHSPADVVALAAGTSRDELDARVSVCRACPRLVEWREQVAREKRASFADQTYWGRPVPSFGDPEASALVIGLAPAAHGANRTGRMFTGDRSGDWLYAALDRAGFANQPHAVSADDGLTLTGLRIIAPAPWLDRDLELAVPNLASIMALGSIAWDSTLAAVRRLGWGVPRPKPKFGHGAEATLMLPDGRPVRLVGCYHVSQQNTFTGRLTQEMTAAVLTSAAQAAGLS